MANGISAEQKERLLSRIRNIEKETYQIKSRIDLYAGMYEENVLEHGSDVEKSIKVLDELIDYLNDLNDRTWRVMDKRFDPMVHDL